MSARCPRRVPIAVRRPQAKAPLRAVGPNAGGRLLIVSGTSEEHTSELQSPDHLVSRLLLEKKIYSGQCKPLKTASDRLLEPCELPPSRPGEDTDLSSRCRQRPGWRTAQTSKVSARYEQPHA